MYKVSERDKQIELFGAIRVHAVKQGVPTCFVTIYLAFVIAGRPFGLTAALFATRRTVAGTAEQVPWFPDKAD